MCATDEMPTTGCFARVDPGLAGGNGYRSGRHAHSRSCATRQGKLFVDAGHVGESWNESDNIDAVCALSMKGNDLRFASPDTLGNVGEVWSEFTALANVDVYFRPARLVNVARARGKMTKS